RLRPVSPANRTPEHQPQPRFSGHTRAPLETRSSSVPGDYPLLSGASASRAYPMRTKALPLLSIRPLGTLRRYEGADGHAEAMKQRTCITPDSYRNLSKRRSPRPASRPAVSRRRHSRTLIRKVHQCGASSTAGEAPGAQCRQWERVESDELHYCLRHTLTSADGIIRANETQKFPYSALSDPGGMPDTWLRCGCYTGVSVLGEQ